MKVRPFSYQVPSYTSDRRTLNFIPFLNFNDTPFDVSRSELAFLELFKVEVISRASILAAERDLPLMTLEQYDANYNECVAVVWWQLYEIKIVNWTIFSRWYKIGSTNELMKKLGSDYIRIGAEICQFVDECHDEAVED